MISGHRSVPTFVPRLDRLLNFCCLFPALVALLFLMAGCGGMGMTSSPMPMPARTAAFAFVSNSSSGTVSVFAVSASGMFTAVPGSPFPAGAGSEFLAVDPVHKLLFVANSVAGTVSVFSINTGTGMLTAAPGSPLAVGARPEGVAVDPMGRFVFVANQAAGTISGFSISAGAPPVPLPGSPFAADAPFGMAFNPAGTLLFVSNFPDSTVSDSNTVSAFQLGVNGALTAAPGSPFATASTPGFAAAVGLTTDPGGRFLLVGAHMTESVLPFSINATNGALAPASALPPPASNCTGACHNNPLRVAVHPSGQLVFATNVQAGSLSVFNLNNGTLSAGSTVPTGQHPFGVATDPSGSFVYVVNKMDSSISGFTVNLAPGTLSSLPGFPMATGGSAPTDIAMIAAQ